jgi:hypothetical protein
MADKHSHRSVRVPTKDNDHINLEKVNREYIIKFNPCNNAIIEYSSFAVNITDLHSSWDASIMSYNSLFIGPPTQQLYQRTN